MKTKLTEAIQRSISHTESVDVEVADVDEALALLHEVWDGEIDHVTVDGQEAVWGWSDDTPKDQQDWKLYLKA